MSRRMTKEELNQIHKPGWQWLGRKLESYQTIHRKTAESKKVLTAFLNARTLTQAKKILFGVKRKQTV